jgi:hypothetical protein
MFGFTYTSATFDNPLGGPDTEYSSTGLSLLWSNPSPSFILTPVSIPHLAADAVLEPGVTLGGTAGVSWTSAESHPEDLDDGYATTITARSLGSRVGYLHAATDTISLWPRVGLSYWVVTLSDEGDDASTTSRSIYVSVDPQVVVTPAPHVSILFGPMVDVSAYGNVSYEVAGQDEESIDVRQLTVGMTSGFATVW